MFPKVKWEINCCLYSRYLSSYAYTFTTVYPYTTQKSLHTI